MSPTSAHNPLLKEIRRAGASGRPTSEGFIVAEGPHLFKEALNSPWTIELILTTPSGLDRYQSLLHQSPAQIQPVPTKTFAQIASTETAQEILCLLRPRTFTWADLLTPPALLIILDTIQDPGNAGTIARSAEAFGATGLLFLEGSVRVSNPKLLRASGGSLFRLPFLERVSTADAIRHLHASGISLHVLTPKGASPIGNANLRAPTALAVGNEGAGISPELASAGIPVAIPTGRVESLNAGVACSLALYEAHNQRVPE